MRTTDSSRPTTWDINAIAPTKQTKAIDLDIDTRKFTFSSPSYDINGSELYEIDLHSDFTKYLLVLEGQFSHAIHDSLALILKLHKLDQQAVFILYKPNSRSIVGAEFVYQYMEQLFTSINLKYILISPLKNSDEAEYYPTITVTNAVDIKKTCEIQDLRLSLNDYLNTVNLICSHITIEEVTPYRKVYLSRSHIDRKDYSPTPAKVEGFKDDVRMENEQILEEFFKSNGYEIIIPEHKFANLQEQIKYMSTVKVLVSVTSSGLLNSLFMKDEQFIVEIVAELVTEDARQQKLAHHYTNYAYIKNHTYFGIQSRRNPEEVIRRLNTIIDPSKNPLIESDHQSKF